MTPEEFEKAVSEIEKHSGWDIEMSHAKADVLLCKVLREAGYEAGVDIYEKLGKWYV